jgi:hypothetical protein
MRRRVCSHSGRSRIGLPSTLLCFVRRSSTPCRKVMLDVMKEIYAWRKIWHCTEIHLCNRGPKYHYKQVNLKTLAGYNDMISKAHIAKSIPAILCSSVHLDCSHTNRAKQPDCELSMQAVYLTLPNTVKSKPRCDNSQAMYRMHGKEKQAMLLHAGS